MANGSNGKGLNTIIGKGSSLEGTLRVVNSLRIEGSVKGKVACSEILTIGVDGQVEAEVEVKSAIISGTLTGNLKAEEKVELEKTARLNGDITARQLVINEGAFFKGSSIMGGEAGQGQ